MVALGMTRSATLFEYSNSPENLQWSMRFELHVGKAAQ